MPGWSPLVGLSGDSLTPGRAAVVVGLCWLTAVPPLLGFTALSVLLSVLSRSPVGGIGGPVFLGLLMQLLALLGGLGTAVNALLVTPFTAWHGLVRDDAIVGPLWQGLLVSLLWGLVSLGLARRVLLSRDVT